MKKNYILGALAVAAMTLISCNKEQDVKVEDLTSEGIPFVISAGSEETKTTNAANTVKWVVDDQIALWHAETTTSTYVADGAFKAATAAASSTFSGTLASALNPAKSYDWYAIYPYESGVNTPESYSYVTIGSAASSAQVQTGYNNKQHLSGVAFPLYGKVEGVAADAQPSISMKHIASVIEFNVTNNYADPIQIQQIQFSSSAASDLIGTYRVNFADGSATLTTATTNSVATLNVDEPVDLASTESAKFYLAIKPFVASTGATITISIKTNEGTQVLSNVVNKDFTFVAGKIHTFNASFTNKTSNLAQFLYNDGDWLDAQGITKPALGEGTGLVDGELQTVGDLSVGSQKLTGSQPMLWNNGGNYQFRLYKKNKFFVGSTNGKVITKITFTGGAMTKTSADVGTFDASNKFWTGRSNQVLFTLADDSSRDEISTINVFYENAEDSEHMLSVPVTALNVDWDATSVHIPLFAVNPVGLSITSGSTGYTGNTPDAGGVTVNFSTNTASAPRAIVVNIKTTNPVVDQDVTITQAGKVVNVSNISGIKAAYDSEGDGVNFSATLSNALVTLLDGDKNFYLQDETGAIMGYSASHGLAVGDKISGTLKGSVTKYRGNYEITDIDYSTATVTHGNTVTPTTITAATLSGSLASYESKLVKVENMTVASVAGDGKTLTIEGTDIKVYNKSGFALPAGSVFNAEGAAAYNNSDKQITVVAIADGNKVSIVPTITASDQLVTVGATVTVSPTSNSNGAFTFTSLNTDKATVVSSTGVVTGVAAGDATIRISQAASGYWAEGTKDVTVTVSASAAKKYTKVSSITSGRTYLIVNANASKAMPHPGSSASLLTPVNVTITSNQITQSAATIACEVVITNTTIQEQACQIISWVDGTPSETRYVSYGTSGTGLLYVTTAPSKKNDACAWTITALDPESYGSFSIQCNSATSRYIRYRTDTVKFGAYTGLNDTYHNVDLFELEE